MCSSDNESIIQNEPVSVEIKEYKTNLPLSGARVSTYSCKIPDIEFGCIEFELFSSCLTDNNGICKLKYPDYFEKLWVEKPNYWLGSFKDRSTKYFISPKAWVDISFITDQEYPSTSTFFISVVGEKSFERHYIQKTGYFNSVFNLFGNEENVIKWVLYENFNATSEILNSGEFRLNPQRFENLTLELYY